MNGADPNRRRALLFLAGGAVMAANAGRAFAKEKRIAGLIGEAQKFPSIRQRIEFISRALLGSPYRSYTLVGGPRQPEQFVTRDDVFDCVTYCETVLAAARVQKSGDFDAALRLIRYRDGQIDWRERNHYFAEWCTRNIANGVCRAVAIPGHATVDKRVSYMPHYGVRQLSMMAIPRASLLANKELVASGDIVGFLSQQAGLDYFHTGFVMVDDNGGLWLRHAAMTRGRVLDEPLGRFLGLYGVESVTLLRPLEVARDAMVAATRIDAL